MDNIIMDNKFYITQMNSRPLTHNVSYLARVFRTLYICPQTVHRQGASSKQNSKDYMAQSSRPRDAGPRTGFETGLCPASFQTTKHAPCFIFGFGSLIHTTNKARHSRIL